MNAHALAILEVPRLLAHVAQRAHSSPGAAAVRALAPLHDRAALEAEHRRVQALRALILDETGWQAEPIPDLAAPLARLRIEGTAWSADELRQGATFLRSSRRVRDALGDARRPAIARGVLAPLAARLVAARAEEEAIERAIADDGTVRDDASPALRAVRHELRRAEGELVKLLEREIARLEPHHQVSDGSVTVRNGRWVIPVRREGRGAVGGIVHDTSGSGATIFVEPPAAVEFGNRIRELELEEQREIERILRELTARLHPLYAPMREAWQALVELDTLFARARYALDVKAAPVEFVAPHEALQLNDARHPLLLAQGVDVVPFTLQLGADERTLLVSGPNTGGKTVLLKAMGLLVVMAQCGIPVPVGAESRLPIVDDVFADVGDEQSIEASLSTFSAHLRNQAEILRSATAASLVLVDELGSGTDPTEGAALGGAILETLTRRGARTVATTHLGQLKLLATDVGGVVNASLQFDAERLAPTYRLIKGIPGRSYGLSIARRLAIPDDVLAIAETRLPQGERDLGSLLADLETREAQLAEREHELAREEQRTRSRTATVTDRERKVREREREQEREGRRDARRWLLDARQELERAVASVKDAAAEAVARAELRAARAESRAEAVARAAAGAPRATTREQAGGDAGAAQGGPDGDASDGLDALDRAMRDARRQLEEAADREKQALADVERRAERDEQRRLMRERAEGVAGDRGAGSDDERAGARPAARGGGRAAKAPTGARTPLTVGDAVRVATLGDKTGRIVELKGREARVAVGDLTLSVPLTKLVRTTPPPAPEVRINVGTAFADADPLREVDLRGLRVDELDEKLLHALDTAVRADQRELRIIHGKGTGVLRERVGEMLRKDTRVAGFRLGAWNEGGAGVTVAELA